MIKRSLIIIGLFIAVGIGGYFLVKPQPKLQSNTQCQVKQITYYYLDTCEVCKEVKKENVIEKLEKLGIKVQKINAAIGPIRHQFKTVPTFVINDKVYSGYKTFEELNQLLGCPKTD